MRIRPSESSLVNIILVLFLMVMSVSCAQKGEIRDGTSSAPLVSLFSAAPGDSISCYRIPAIVTAVNGDIIVAIDERVPSCADLRDNPNINIVIRRSSDNGLSWTAVERVVDFPLGESASDPSMIVDRETGTIFLFYNYMNLKSAKGSYYFQVISSTDNGKSWSTPTDITAQISKVEWLHDFKFITSGRGIQTRDGKLLHTLVHLDNGVYIFGSDDHGRTWYLIDTPIHPADESKLVELSDGSWLLNSRVNSLGYRYVHTTNNQGISWASQVDSSLIDPGCNASIIRYELNEASDLSPMLLFVNADDPEERKRLSLKYSLDDAQSWSNPKIIYEGSAAYSEMTLLENGDLAIFFERDEYSDNVIQIIIPEWIKSR